MPPKFSEVASSPATAPVVASVTMPTIASITTPTITAASPIIVHNPSPSMMRATPTPATPATQPVYYVQISGGTPSQPVLVRPIRQQQQQPQSPVVKIVDGPVPNCTQPGGHGDQQVNHANGSKAQKPTSYHDNTKEAHVMQFANQVKDMGTNISVKMGATYNMVSEYMLISKFEEAWNKLNELAAQWQQPKQQPPAVTKKPVVTTKIVQRPSVSSTRDKVVMVAQQQQQTPQQIPQQQTLQQQTMTTPVQLVPISAPHHVNTPIVHGDVVSVLSSPAHVIPSPAHVISTPGHVISTPGHVISNPGHVISTPGHVISTPVVIPAVARTGSDVTYYSIPPKANVNPVVPAAMHPHKNKDEVYMVQVVKPVAPVMPVTPVMSIRSSEKRTAQQCDVCSKKASFLCSGCQSAWYCGRSCQVRTYPIMSNSR